MNILSDFLNTQLEQRGWSKRELGRRAGISSTQVADVISGRSNPGADFCISIARALGEPPEHILRLAGILPPLPPSVAGERETLTYFRHLDERLRPAILATLRNLSHGSAIAERREPYDVDQPRTITEHIARILARDLETLTADDQRQVFDLINQLKAQHTGGIDETA